MWRVHSKSFEEIPGYLRSVVLEVALLQRFQDGKFSPF